MSSSRALERRDAGDQLDERGQRDDGTAIVTRAVSASAVIDFTLLRRSGLGRAYQHPRGDKAGNGRDQQREQDHGRKRESELHA